MFERARAAADAVLFEGYLLFPYTASARKNQLRWQFGVLPPPAWCAPGGGEHPWMQTECVFELRGAPRIEARLRFLRVEQRIVEEADGAGGFRPVEQLEIAGRRHIPWDEGAIEEIAISARGTDGATAMLPFSLAASERLEVLTTSDGAIGGRIVRRRLPMTGLLTIEILRTGTPGFARVLVRAENRSTGVGPGAPREQALRHSLVGAHLLLGLSEGAFMSAIDPDDAARELVAACENMRLFPVLAGAPGDRSEILAAPIILYDHPEIAPESPGHTFDGTEIDELLALTTLSLTDEERAEARATDDRAGEMLDRFASMPPAMWERLHGALRSVGPSSAAGERVPASVRVGAVEVSPGHRVRMRPGRRADAQDMFLDGRIGRVEKIYRDFEGRDYLAVVPEDDPAVDLYVTQGRHLFFSPDEVEPLEAPR